MKFYTLAGLMEKAKKLGRKLCCWTPHYVRGLGDHRWVHDVGAKLRDWVPGRGKHSTRIIVHPNGRVDSGGYTGNL